MFYFIRERVINTDGNPIPLVVAALLVVGAWLFGPYLRGDADREKCGAEADSSANGKRNAPG